MVERLETKQSHIPHSFVDPDGINYGVERTDNVPHFIMSNITVVDSSTGALISIPYSHHEIHAGSAYRAGMNYVLANGEVATFSITTPNTTKWLHIGWELTTTADGTFALLEDVTSFSGGSAVVPLNHNRNSLNVSGATCLRGMTGVDLITPTGGTQILGATLSTGKGAISSREQGQEFIFKQNSKYLFRYTNGINANTILLKCEWYEHANI